MGMTSLQPGEAARQTNDLYSRQPGLQVLDASGHNQADNPSLMCGGSLRATARLERWCRVCLACLTWYDVSVQQLRARAGSGAATCSMLDMLNA
jgi:hypothetical protein